MAEQSSSGEPKGAPLVSLVSIYITSFLPVSLLFSVDICVGGRQAGRLEAVEKEARRNELMMHMWNSGEQNPPASRGARRVRYEYAETAP